MEKIMMMHEDTLLERRDAAAYLHMTTRTFSGQMRGGTGPAHVRISPHKVLFRVADLDAWRNSWQVVKNATKD